MTEHPCKICFQRRAWKTNIWVVVSKWHDVGDGLCLDCAKTNASHSNDVQEEKRKRNERQKIFTEGV